MADVQSISALDPAAITANMQFLIAALQDVFPSMDLSAGSVFTQLLLRPAAIFHTLNETNLAIERQSGSLLDIRNNPALADDTAVDEVLSNFNISRYEGGTAIGNITIVVSSNNLLPIPTSLIFTANGVTFTTPAAYAAVPDSSNIVDPDTDIVFTARSDGTYSVTVPLTAQAAGSAANLTQGTQFTSSPVLANVITITASSDFAGGSDLETNADLLSRLSNGITSRNGGGRASISAWIKETYPTVTDISLIGAGDPELTRSGHNTLGVKVPGYSDIYLRTRSKPAVIQIDVVATLQDAVNQNWSFSFDRDAYPGLYYLRVLPASSAGDPGTLPLVSVDRVIDRSHVATLDFTPNMPEDIEGAFTRYQTVQVIFTDMSVATNGLTVGTSQNTYSVEVTYMGPELATISDWLTTRDRRPPGDYLIKAPLPCFVAVGMKIITGAGDQPLTDDQIQQIQNAVADAINEVDFATGRLDAAIIVDAAQQQIVGGRTRVQLPLDLRGEVIFPDGTSGWLFSPQDNDNGHSLVAPHKAHLMCSPRTVSFYGDPTRVSVTVVGTTAPPV